jgi:hypothetical protein
VARKIKNALDIIVLDQSLIQLNRFGLPPKQRNQVSMRPLLWLPLLACLDSRQTENLHFVTLLDKRHLFKVRKRHIAVGAKGCRCLQVFVPERVLASQETMQHYVNAWVVLNDILIKLSTAVSCDCPAGLPQSFAHGAQAS